MSTPRHARLDDANQSHRVVLAVSGGKHKGPQSRLGGVYIISVYGGKPKFERMPCSWVGLEHMSTVPSSSYNKKPWRQVLVLTLGCPQNH